MQIIGEMRAGRIEEAMALCRKGARGNLFIKIPGTAESLPAIEGAVRELASRDHSTLAPAVEEAALEGLKFSQCLPKELALATLVSRLRDVAAIRAASGAVGRSTQSVALLLRPARHRA